MLNCITKISIKIRKYFVEFYTVDQLHKIVDFLLLNGINWDILNYLDFIDSTNVSDLSINIQIKLLLNISFVLKQKFYPFTIRGTYSNKYGESLKSFQADLTATFKKNQQFIFDEETQCVCLSCLSKFQFKDFEEQMVSFGCFFFRILKK